MGAPGNRGAVRTKTAGNRKADPIISATTASIANRAAGAVEANNSSAQAGAGDTGTGTAQIIVNHLHGRPTQGTCSIGQAVLATSALVIVEHLVACRLANVNEGAAGEMFSRDLGHHGPPRRPDRPTGSDTTLRRPPPPEELGATASAWSGVRAEAPSAVLPRRTDPSDRVALSAWPAPLQRGKSPAYEAMSASTSARRYPSFSIGSRGRATSW